MNPLLTEVAVWFGIGSAVAGFVSVIILILAASFGAVPRIAHAVGTRFDKVANVLFQPKHAYNHFHPLNRY